MKWTTLGRELSEKHEKVRIMRELSEDHVLCYEHVTYCGSRFQRFKVLRKLVVQYLNEGCLQVLCDGM